MPPFSIERSTPARQPSACLSAPVEAGQGEGTSSVCKSLTEAKKRHAQLVQIHKNDCRALELLTAHCGSFVYGSSDYEALSDLCFLLELRIEEREQLILRSARGLAS